MKYHTTISNIIFGLVLLCAVLVLVFSFGNLSLVGQAGDRLTQQLLDTISGQGDLQISIGSIDTSLLSHIVLRDTTVSDNSGTSIAEVQSITVKVPAYRFMTRRLYPKRIPIEIDRMQAVIDESSLALFESVFNNAVDTDMANQPDPWNPTISLTILDSDVGFAFQETQAHIEHVEGVVVVEGGAFTQANLQVGRLDLDMPGIGIESGMTSVDIGTTRDGTVGIRVDTFGTSSDIGSLQASIHTDSIGFSLIGGSLEEMLALTGTAGLNIVGFSISTEQNGGASGSIGNMSAQGEVLKGTISSIAGNIGRLEAGYQGWKASVASLSGIFTQSEPGTFELSSTSAEDLFVSLEDRQLVDIARPLFDISSFGNISSIRLGSERIRLMDIPFLSQLLDMGLEDIHAAELEEAHVLVIRNSELEESNAESSFLLRADTAINHLQHVTAEVSGDIAFSETAGILQAQGVFRNIGSQGLPGYLEGNLIYTNREEEQLSAQLDYLPGVQSSFDYDFGSEQARLSIRLNGFSPYPLMSVVDSLSPTIGALLVAETTFEGNLNLQSKRDGSIGRATAEIGIANLAVDEQRFNIATTLAGAMDPDSFTIDLATFTTEGYRLSYDGKIDRQRLVPEGTLDISSVDRGDTIVAADFERAASQIYRYGITSPKLSGSSLDGQISWAEDNVLTADAVLSVPGADYPVNLRFDVTKGLVTLESDNLDAAVDVISEPGHITLGIDFQDLPLPPAIGGDTLRGQGILDGAIGADISIADGLFIVNSEKLSLSGFSWGTMDPWSLTMSIDADPTQLQIGSIAYEDGYGILSGFLSVYNESLKSLFSRNADNLSIMLKLDGTAGESIHISVFPDEETPSVSKGSWTISNFPVGRFNILEPDALFDFTLVGESDLQDHTFAHAITNLDFGGMAKSNLSFDLQIDNEAILVENGIYTSGNLSVTVPEFSSVYDGGTTLEANLSLESPITWRDATTTTSIVATTELAPSGSFFDWMSNLSQLRDAIPPVTISHDDTRLLGDIEWNKGIHEIRYAGNVLSIVPMENGTLDGSYDFSSGDMSLLAKEGFPIPIHVTGVVDSQRISLDIQNISFDMRFLNSLFLEPILAFNSGVVHGSLLIEGPLGDPDYFGTLYANSVELTTFWTPGEHFSLKNPIITVSENLASVAASPVSAVHESGRSTQAVAQLEASIERWGIPHYRIDILGTEDPVSLWIPMYAIDINVEAMVSGSFSIDGTPTEESLYGDVTVSDGEISFGTPTPPSWFVDKARTSIDMTLRTGRNVSFIFPNEEAPILRATFADEQQVGIVVQAPLMTTSFSGELAFRSGEIFYVQKNFYITEGSLKFPPIGNGLTTDVLPTLSLRARLREFDADGNRIDIFLVLQDSSFLDLNPRFESIPLRSTNEILELLGQNIVAAGTAGDSGLQSIVSVASAATDVFSRLGILQNTTISLGFSKIIREALGLDVFTIRTNLLQNILFEALPGIAADTSVSPIARYLDNTTMYIGKYLLDEFYLQGMLHFRQDVLGQSTSFLADDLKIDTELSIEWSNPLATFSFFTQPEELSVFDLFDTMGFSITKRFEF
ncbi:MAG TPA: hypothetical protein DIW48_00255 [Sphaerochaeta sp.]|nr:hypothetical protein [Sphaerochaeta sp.]